MDQEAFHSFIGVYSLILTIIGILTNLIVHITCLTKSLRSVPTFVIISLIALSDSISLCFWNLDHFLHQFFNYVQEDLSLGMCRLVSFLQCSSLQCSAWLLVLMSIERFLSVQIKSWRIAYSNTKKALISAIFVIAIIISINFHLLFTINYDQNINATVFSDCLTSDIYLEWMTVHIWLYSVVPFVLLLITNFLLINKLCFSEQKQLNNVISNESKSKRKASGYTVICLTMMFLLMTLPQTIIRGFFITTLSSQPSGISVVFFCDSLAFTYHGLTFFILLLSNKKFSNQFKLIFKISNKNSRVSTVNTT